MMPPIPTLSHARSSGSSKDPTTIPPILDRSRSGGSKSSVPRQGRLSSGSRKSAVGKVDNTSSTSSTKSKKRDNKTRHPSGKQLSFRKHNSKQNSINKKTKGLSDEVSNSLKDAIQHSPILSTTPEPFVRYFDPTQVIKGGKFAPGEFYDILRIKHLPSDGVESLLDCTDPYLDKSAELKGDSDHSLSFGSTSFTMKTYILKQVSQKHKQEKAIMSQATLRLVLEAKYLARLNHPNLVQARGLTNGEEEPLLHGGVSGFFIVTELFVETLEQRLERWRKEPPDDSAFDPKSKNVQRKLRYAMALAEVLKYLHDRNLVVLNLRPETIGFLEDGTIQIRDLTCCREMSKHRQKDEEPLGFDCALQVREDAHSQMAAAKSNFLVLEASVDGLPRPRYVAPEAIMEHVYTPAADTYSWAHVFFELLTLSKPYAKYKLGTLLTKVCLEGSRPNLSVYKFPQQLENLLRLSWRTTYSMRPSMKALLEAIPILMELNAKVVANPQA